MNTLRNTLKQHYSQIPNELITDMTLNAGELRVLLYLFTKPDNWNVYNRDICKQLHISEQTLTKYWKALLKSQWLRREIASSGDGKFTGGYIYHIGNFTVSIESTETVNSIEHSNTKPIKKQLTNTNTNVATAEKIANHLLTKIKDHKPNFVPQAFHTWVTELDRAIRIDNRTEQELLGCINWIYSDNKGAFWIPNILSGKKLREKFDTMEAQMISKSKKSDNGLDAMLEVYNAGK